MIAFSTPHHSSPLHLDEDADVVGDHSTNVTSSLNEEIHTKLPFFATLKTDDIPTTDTLQSLETMHTAAKERKEDRMLTRRDAFRYGGMLAGTAFITAFTQTKVNEKMPPPPERPSLIPKPVLPITNNAKEKQQQRQIQQQQGELKVGTTAPKAPAAAKPLPTKISSNKTVTPATASKAPPAANTIPTKVSTNKTATLASPGVKTSTGQFTPVNLTQVVRETNINVTKNCDKMCVSIDSSNFAFTKVEKPKVPSWLPSFLAPKPRIVKQYSNSELLIAATAAGSISEMGRTALLYPLSTVKTRLQADKTKLLVSPNAKSEATLSFLEEVRGLGNNIRRKVDEGDLYAGISPTLLVSVPATGIYYGVRDVTKRILYMTPLDSTLVAVGGALVGDVVSLCFRTPSEALAIRLQAKNETTGDWLGDSLKRLPMVILTDLPYLISKIILNKSLIQGSISVSDYAEYAIIASVIAGFLTTPFDVARTRILLNKRLVVTDDEEVQGIMELLSSNSTDEMKYTHELSKVEGGENEVLPESTTPEVAITRPDYSLVKTMVEITKEGDRGVRNLFSGWLERVLYLGIGRAWLEPIQLIEYIGIRDAVLLEWF